MKLMISRTFDVHSFATDLPDAVQARLSVTRQFGGIASADEIYAARDAAQKEAK